MKAAAKESAVKTKVAKPLDEQVREALKWLKSRRTRAIRDGMARYAIPSKHALGVAMKDIKTLGKRLGQNQELAAALWET
ncbi:MAG: hypothetical protein HY013_19195, partial [Candidatus Solibacter usitatus]|nr:hypothetical protein [Candidatus Solibacter usitatus]